MEFLRTLPILFWSLYYLKPSMVYWRIHRTVKRGLISIANKLPGAKAWFSASGAVPPHTVLPPVSSRYYCEEIDLERGVFTFLNDRVE
ncbi:MAG: hypothetical protein CL946_13745, partial [Ectothiorhodospiraceae bacterium]|nr:hypothetical protein [Ectothiorhodospiraceae bacterium]